MALIFFLFFVYGLATHHYGGALIALAVIPMYLIADRRFKRADAEWEKMHQARQSLILASETMMEVHECECTALCLHNQLGDMQVAD